jgi:hypothetical protein
MDWDFRLGDYAHFCPQRLIIFRSMGGIHIPWYPVRAPAALFLLMTLNDSHTAPNYSTLT